MLLLLLGTSTPGYTVALDLQPWNIAQGELDLDVGHQEGSGDLTGPGYLRLAQALPVVRSIMKKNIILMVHVLSMRPSLT